jgi:hypothetical protein
MGSLGRRVAGGGPWGYLGLALSLGLSARAATNRLFLSCFIRTASIAPHSPIARVLGKNGVRFGKREHFRALIGVIRTPLTSSSLCFCPTLHRVLVLGSGEGVDSGMGM